eukprot:7643286-Alexandrium_andersonii.AAC.1
MLKVRDSQPAAASSCADRATSRARREKPEKRADIRSRPQALVRNPPKSLEGLLHVAVGLL